VNRIGPPPARESCPQGLCDGSGWLVTDEGEARPCECREVRIARARRRVLGSGVPRRYLREASFDSNPVRQMDPVVVGEVRRFVHRVKENVGAGHGRWFHGEDTGTGKTLLAMLISKAALDAGLSVAIYSVPRLLAEIKETFEEGASASYMGLFRTLCEVDLLHLDDLGSERRTEWVLEQLYSIVNERWQDERSIVVTSNASYDELREQIGHRTVSRLLGICGLPIPVEGGDHRLLSASAGMEPGA
jgi:DNA replication protein DnaC